MDAPYAPCGPARLEDDGVSDVYTSSTDVFRRFILTSLRDDCVSLRRALSRAEGKFFEAECTTRVHPDKPIAARGGSRSQAPRGRDDTADSTALSHEVVSPCRTTSWTPSWRS